MQPSGSVIPDAVIQDWQSVVDLVARLTGVRACLVMGVRGEEIEVLVASDTPDNPYRAGDRERLVGAGLYCERVIGSGQMLLVPDARCAPEWKANPDLHHNLVSYLGVPLRWPDGRVCGTFCVLDDKANAYSDTVVDLVGKMRDLIEGRLKLEHALGIERQLAGESYVRRILDKVPVAVGCTLLGTQGVVLYLNEAFVRQFGYTLDEVPTFDAWVAATRPVPLKHDVPFERWRMAMRAAFRHGGRMPPAEFRFHCKDGRGAEMLVSTEFEGDLLVASFVDVTLRNRAEEQLRLSEQRHRLMAERAVDTLWVFEIDKGLTYISPSIAKLTGYTPEEYLGLSLAEMFAPESYVDVLAEMDRARAALAAGRPFLLPPREMLGRRKDGSTVWCEMTASGLPVSDGRLGELVGISRDISERKRNEEHKQRILSMFNASQLGLMQEFNASVAHELNQPLGAILRNAEAAAALLEGDQPDLDELRAIVADIRRDDQRAATIIRRIRDVLAKRGLQLRSLSLRDEVADCVDMVRAELAARRIALVVEIPPHLPRVAADRIQLQQVLLNLVKNAMDALAGQPQTRRRIVIAAGCLPEGRVELSVRDSGEGIRPEDMDKLFEYYYTTRPEGLGMGLPLSRTIVEGHGGQIRVASDPGRGTEVVITLKQADTRRTP